MADARAALRIDRRCEHALGCAPLIRKATFSFLEHALSL
jgi:hypothetical protein